MTASSTPGRMTMDVDLRDAVSATMRSLLDRAPRLFLWWWVSLIVIFTVLAGVRDVFTTVESSTWQWAAVAPKVLMLIAGAVAATGLLPQYVAHGITRRAFSLAAGVVIVVFALAGAVIAAGGYAVEAVVYTALGWQQIIDEPHLYASAGQWYLIIPEFTLLFIAWTATGWLGAIGFYRWVGFTGWDWLRGMLFLIPASLPLVVAEAFKAWSAQGGLPVILGLAGMLLAGIAGAGASYLVTRDMPLRGSAGWAA